MSEQLRNLPDPPQERRTKVLQSKVTSSELLLIQKKKSENAAYRAMSMSDFIRFALHEQLGTKVPDD